MHRQIRVGLGIMVSMASVGQRACSCAVLCHVLRVGMVWKWDVFPAMCIFGGEGRLWDRRGNNIPMKRISSRVSKNFHTNMIILKRALSLGQTCEGWSGHFVRKMGYYFKVIYSSVEHGGMHLTVEPVNSIRSFQLLVNKQTHTGKSY